MPALVKEEINPLRRRWGNYLNQELFGRPSDLPWALEIDPAHPDEKSWREIGNRKVDNVLAAAPELLIAANPGCTLQIQMLLRERGKELRCAHPIEVLDASITGRAGWSTAAP